MENNKLIDIIEEEISCFRETMTNKSPLNIYDSHIKIAFFESMYAFLDMEFCDSDFDVETFDEDNPLDRSVYFWLVGAETPIHMLYYEWLKDNGDTDLSFSYLEDLIFSTFEAYN